MNIRRYIMTLAFGVSLGVSLANFSWAADDFLSGFEDLPLMPGLSEVPDSLVSFDTPAGRILEAYAVGQKKTKDVAAFYDQTLPQLGWKNTTGTTFQREGEKLAIEITGSGKSLTVRFTLSPQ